MRMKRLNLPAETADIVDLSHEGKGVARIDGKTVFVADALPGERVRLRRIQRHRSYDDAVCEEVLLPSPDRVSPACDHFGTCGGCTLQHLSSAAQIAFKQSQLTENLARIGGVSPAQWLPPLTGSVWGYRRRARLGIKDVTRKGRVLVGFRERAAPYIAELRQCPVLAPPVDRLLESLGALVQSLSIPNRIPQAEVAVGEGACVVVLRNLDPLTAADHQRLVDYEQVHGVRMYLQPGGPGTVVPVAGSAAQLHYTLPQFDITVQFEPTDFVQINGELNRKMVTRAIELLACQSGDQLLDLFCGLGNFSLPLARTAASVTGVEGDTGLVQRARENAERNGLTNVAFHAADLFGDVSGAPWASRAYDRVLIDPPRAGAREVLPLVARSGARRVLYISCHPGSLARDAGLLVNEHGFALTAAGVMDMFPHTAHVEAIAVFDR
jgi:23S rRNA (uracil1939-C5)-methyltransferase